MINITSIIENEIRNTGVMNGIVTIFVPHTTAGITINENADPDVIHDILFGLSKIVHKYPEFKHFEGNSHAHIKASLMGSSCNVIIEDGRLKLGTWQGVYFCEFDGPRNRKIYVKLIEG
jgi:secondary thiamine-phosphate synthase enzyme